MVFSIIIQHDINKVYSVINSSYGLEKLTHESIHSYKIRLLERSDRKAKDILPMVIAKIGHSIKLASLRVLGTRPSLSPARRRDFILNPQELVPRF